MDKLDTYFKRQCRLYKRVLNRYEDNSKATMCTSTQLNIFMSSEREISSCNLPKTPIH